MNGTYRVFLIAGLIALGALAVACGSSTEAETPASVVQTVPVRTVAVETRDLTETLTLTGSLDPRAHVPVVAEVSARLLKVLSDEGDRVSQGTLVAVLDDTDFRLARDRAVTLPPLALPYSPEFERSLDPGRGERLMRELLRFLSEP